MLSGRGNRKQYYEQEGAKSMQIQKNYYHSKLLLYYPWNHEDDIISTFTTYHKSYMRKKDIIHHNTNKFNEDHAAFDLDLQDLENNMPQSAWEMVAPNITQDDRAINVQGFCTLQNKQQEKEDTIDAVSHDNTRNTTDTLCMLYAKAAKRQDMNFQDYCRCVCTLNTDQYHIVMYNRAWCKSYINAVRYEKKQEGFVEWSRGTGKSHVVHLIQRDMSHFFKHTVKPDDDQPVIIPLVFRKLLYTDLFVFLLTSVLTSTFPCNFFSLELSYPYMILLIPIPNH